MIDSICGLDEMQILKNYISHLEYSSLLCIYKASVDGFGAEDFHRKCDEKDKILVLIKANEYLFGGYSEQAFNSTGEYIKSDQSFIFSLSNPLHKPTKFNCFKHHYSIYEYFYLFFFV